MNTLVAIGMLLALGYATIKIADAWDWWLSLERNTKAHKARIARHEDEADRYIFFD
jgi:hypothetical protein